jgi:hypothetical protein
MNLSGEAITFENDLRFSGLTVPPQIVTRANEVIE